MCPADSCNKAQIRRTPVDRASEPARGGKLFTPRVTVRSSGREGRSCCRTDATVSRSPPAISEDPGGRRAAPVPAKPPEVRGLRRLEPGRGMA